MIDFCCPACKQAMKLDESFAGLRVVCVGCGRQVAVPDGRQPAACSTARPSPAMSAAHPAHPEPTLLDRARRHRDLIVGGLIVVVLGVAAAVLFSSMPDGPAEDGPHRIAGRHLDNRSPGTAIETSRNDRPQAAAPVEPELPTGDSPRGESTAAMAMAKATESTKAPAATPPDEPAQKKESRDKPEKANDRSASGEQPAAAASSATYESPAGILLRESSELNDWLAVARDAELPAGTRLAQPGPFTGRLDVGRQYTVHLLPGTRGRLREPVGEIPFGCELERGRLIVDGQLAGNSSGPVVSLAVGGDVWTVALLSGDTVFGVEIQPRRPERFEQDFGRDNLVGGILVAKGSVRITDAAGRSRVAAGNSWISLARGDRVDDQTAGGNRPPQQLPEPNYRPLPGWLDLDKLAAGPAADPAGELFERTYNRQQEFTQAIVPVLTSTDERAVVLAVQCQALLGRRAALIGTLAAAKHAAVRTAAAEGLRDLLPASREQRAQLQDELRTAFGPGGGDVYLLLWGYSEDELRNNRFTCFQLVHWLTDEQLVVRELAWSEITGHSAARYAYNPSSPLRARRRAAKQWEAHVLRQGTILGDELR